ncbi:gas vesicle protein [Alkalinema sp. FACHB-956]|uniref:gas vesicle protein n=1 Tax=Alkalinema sp. FACHB-956 TaxID=2692768 RepID=UPI001685FF0D|nr:gas vesicle protein [Alkalinema sp. FACHB-956]MBD2329475.1 gas vesicle protein [Alkalinema sp. FACHB-956]
MRRPPHAIHSKISTMPRPKTEASQYLDLYKMAIEKSRLENELATIEQRRLQIEQRLEQLAQKAVELEQSALSTALSASAVTSPESTRTESKPALHLPVLNRSDYQTFVLEY